MWRAKLRPGSSSSFAHRAHHPGRALHQVGNTVLSIVGVRSMDLLFWEERMQAVSDELIVCTDDGSYGREALVIAPLQEILESGRTADRVWAIGPAIMKFCALTTQPFGVPTIVNLNSIMVGTKRCTLRSSLPRARSPGARLRAYTA
jgi:ferredoxin/flavodoxin---NADP+ reductase